MNGSHRLRALVLLLTVALAGCSLDLELPTPTDEADIYSGTWRGTIGDFTVTAWITAERDRVFLLSGEAACQNLSTGEGMTLHSGGQAAERQVALNLFRDSVRTEFQGQVSGDMPDNRTIAGTFRGPRALKQGL
jgi:hypothetical protein